MSKWYHLPTTVAMTEGEYRANINGINMVFGAVLGFVLAGSENMPTESFLAVLLMSVGVVVSILYLASSEYRLFYALLTALTIFLLPHALHDILVEHPMPKLQPTLAAWAITVLFIELLPRTKRENLSRTKRANKHRETAE